jgi:hypothetical protein
MRALRDGAPLEDGDARELWAHFSAWMDEHPGDLAGFAAALGVKSVRPALAADGPVLLVSTTEEQSAYAHATRLGASAKREKGAAAPSKSKQKSGKSQRARAPAVTTPARPKQPR